MSISRRAGICEVRSLSHAGRRPGARPRRRSPKGMLRYGYFSPRKSTKYLRTKAVCLLMQSRYTTGTKNGFLSYGTTCWPAVYKRVYCTFETKSTKRSGGDAGPRTPCGEEAPPENRKTARMTFAIFYRRRIFITGRARTQARAGLIHDKFQFAIFPDDNAIRPSKKPPLPENRHGSGFLYRVGK